MIPFHACMYLYKHFEAHGSDGMKNSEYNDSSMLIYTKNQWVQTTTLGKRHHEIQTSDAWTLETNSLKRTWKLMGMEDDPFFLYLGLSSGGELLVSCGVFFGTPKRINRSTVVAFMPINRSNVATIWGHHLRSISKSARVTADFCGRRDGLGEDHV